MAVGILFSQAKEIRPWVLAFTAGNFIYIALADLVPELLHEHHQLRLVPSQQLSLPGEDARHVETRWKGLIMNAGILFGILLMSILGLAFED
jgi:zinc transporter ZupT